MDKHVFSRFCRNVAVPDGNGCMIWTGKLYRNGYGKMRIGAKVDHLVHRLSYQHFIGETRKGLEIDHLCRVRNCVAPNHLEQVTKKENNFRARRTHCRKGHEYSMTRSGVKVCRLCMNAYARTRYVATQPWNRDKTHCKNGHEFTLENTYIANSATSLSGKCRECRTCKNESWMRLYRKKHPIEN